MGDWIVDHFVWVAAIVLVLLGVLFVTAHIYDERAWTEFVKEHECRVVGKTSSSTATTVAPVIGGNGGVSVGTTVIPGKTGWLCNDGITYWR